MPKWFLVPKYLVSNPTFNIHTYIVDIEADTGEGMGQTVDVNIVDCNQAR